jgi:NAD(P)-dependent dehydrogenase (short-subunit alcohol dehydrogenase family)
VTAADQRVLAGGPLTGLVNNAGVALPAPLEHIPIEVFRRQLEVKLTGQLADSQAMLPALRKSREQGAGARIVMIGSIGGRIDAPMLGAYHVSKFGKVGLADTLRAELAPAGIRVILIEPGAIATPIWDRGAAAGNELLAGLPEEGRRRHAGQIATARSSAASPRGAGRGQGADHRQPPAQVPDRTGRARRRGGRPAPHRLRYRLTTAKR